MSKHIKEQIFIGKKQNYKFIETLRKEHKCKACKVQGLEDNKYYCLKIFNRNRFEAQKPFLESVQQHLSDDQYILQIKEWFEKQLDIYLILELCEEGDVGLMLQKGSFDEQMIKSIIHQVGYQIDKFHQLGFFCIGIKPEIIVKKANQNLFKLCDFKSLTTAEYLKNIREQDDWTKTASYVIYAPESMSNFKNINSSIDIWSFGVTIYQIMTKKQLFEDANQFQIYCKIEEYVKNQTEIHKQIDQCAIDDKIKKFIKSMLHPEPQQRPKITVVNDFFKSYYQKQSQMEDQQKIIEELQLRCQELEKENGNLQKSLNDIKNNSLEIFPELFNESFLSTIQTEKQDVNFNLKKV